VRIEFVQSDDGVLFEKPKLHSHLFIPTEIRRFSVSLNPDAS